MENGGEFIPVCPLPWDAPNDVIPMLVVIACFVLIGWAVRRWSRKRKARRSAKGKSGP